MIRSRIDAVKRLLDKILAYEQMIEADNFEPDTVEDMKGNAKGLCDAAKNEIGNIKTEVDQWQ